MSAAIPAMVSFCKLPVVSVIHHISTNWVREDPIKEKACPKKIIQ